LAPELAERICACRRETGWGPRLVAGATGFCHSTVSKVLNRAGISRPPQALREPANRYEWPCPGDLLHMDTSEYVRFQRPGHRVTGDRSSQQRHHHDGVDIVHAIIDDHSRLAYAEIHPDQQATTAAAFLERALRFYQSHGIVAKRLMTDNAWIYVRSRAMRQLLTRHEIRHLTTKPYRPRTNGKVERFHQTMAREWAYGLVYRSHHERAAALPHWLDHYNTTRPHSSLGNRPPISRVHNVRRQDN
jgi:transposase InsO family protein